MLPPLIIEYVLLISYHSLSGFVKNAAAAAAL